MKETSKQTSLFPSHDTTKQPWEMTREEYLSNTANELNYSGITPRDRSDVNRVVRLNVERSNYLQKKTNKMVDDLIKEGKSTEDAWKIVEQSPEWKEFTSTKPDVNKFHDAIDKHEQALLVVPALSLH